ncbi:unnamed protein product [Chondrus crispus]|uniref:RanBD1 domain-containing protein n=1 Tax=Chondrus crispus TaxID=2769 RepID=R7QK89_CHOCR|nr:unnamed protein product [Chondrus crispus]CDF38178.1 unnamed protein product [Chondrus crispus]|eukprot:XP_005718047.1 unnamed protein product [Chondrus crispus]
MSDPVATPAAPAAPTKDAEAIVKDEDCSKEYEPVVRLAEVETKTGEEDEEVVFKMRSKLFRFNKEQKEWKERGTGDVRILKHKENRKIRLLMRREKTLKICLNHYINPSVELRENVGSDRSWVWHGVDYADGERDEATLAIRFRDSTNATAFKEAYDSARDYLRKLLDGKDPDAAAGEEVKAEEAKGKESPEEVAKVDAPNAEEAKEDTKEAAS